MTVYFGLVGPLECGGFGFDVPGRSPGEPGGSPVNGAGEGA